MKLYSYCIPYDDGAAPNPYWGICTLAICKPVIRRTASIGDWIVATGAKNVRGKDYSNKLVYAMKVTSKIILEEYDDLCRIKYPEKIPDIENSDPRRRLGDCIYYYSGEKPKQRPGVHSEGNISRDISGKNVLVSNHFYYFGENSVKIPDFLRPIVRQGQGHKSDSNQPYILKFLEWVDAEKWKLNHLYGNPQLDILKNPEVLNYCAICRALEK